MRTRNMNRGHRAFTLIEILIVVVILGILAAIVIPQFTDASEDAADAALRSTLQTVRSQIELYRVKTLALPDFVGTGWTDLVVNDYIQDDPRNPVRDNATDIVTGVAVPPAASGALATDGWYWNTATSDMYAVDLTGDLMDW